MSWLRFDDNFLSHPKVRCLSDPQLRVWLRMLSVCSQHDDPTVDKHVISEVKGLGDSLVTKFAEIGLLDETPHGYRVHNWKRYRPKDPTAAERKQRQRDRERDENRDMNRDENVTRARDVPDPSRNKGSSVSEKPLPAKPAVANYAEREPERFEPLTPIAAALKQAGRQPFTNEDDEWN